MTVPVRTLKRMPVLQKTNAVDAIGRIFQRRLRKK